MGDPTKRRAGCYALRAPNLPRGHPVTPPVASKARGFVPVHAKPLPPRKKRPFRQREDSLSCRFPVRGQPMSSRLLLSTDRGVIRRGSAVAAERKLAARP